MSLIEGIKINEVWDDNEETNGNKKKEIEDMKNSKKINEICVKLLWRAVEGIYKKKISSFFDFLLAKRLKDINILKLTNSLDIVQKAKERILKINIFGLMKHKISMNKRPWDQIKNKYRRLNSNQLPNEIIQKYKKAVEGFARCISKIVYKRKSQFFWKVKDNFTEFLGNKNIDLDLSIRKIDNPSPNLLKKRVNIFQKNEKIKKLKKSEERRYLNTEKIRAIFDFAIILNPKLLMAKYEGFQQLYLNFISIEVKPSYDIKSPKIKSNLKIYSSPTIKTSKELNGWNIEASVKKKKKIQYFSKIISLILCRHLQKYFEILKIIYKNRHFLLIRMNIIFEQFFFVKRSNLFKKWKKLISSSRFSTPKKLSFTTVNRSGLRENSYLNPKAKIQMLPTYFLEDDIKSIIKSLSSTYANNYIYKKQEYQKLLSM